MIEVFQRIMSVSYSASWLIITILGLRFLVRRMPKWGNVLLWGLVALRLLLPFSIESRFSMIPGRQISENMPTMNYIDNPVFNNAAVSMNGDINTTTIFNIVWLVGVIILLTYSAVRYWRLLRKLHTAILVRDNIFQSEAVDAPVVVGFVNPKIYLPFNVKQLDVNYIIAHEQAHIRRRDHWWKLLGFVLLTLHWFNPLVWIAWEYFFDDPARYAETIRAALADNPGNEDLLCALLDSYEYTLRNFDDRNHLDEMIDISHQLISSSRDFVKVCNVKDDLAAAYLKKGQYHKAKEILESLPRDVTLKDGSMAFRLSGQDKIDAAQRAVKIHLQDLYLACYEEGNGWYKQGEYQKALDAYTKGLTVLTTFMIPGGVAEGAYLWAGMQTLHYGFHLCRAGCLKKLGRAGECPAEVETAYRIISTAWSDFEEKTDYYMENFHECLGEFDLKEFWD